MREIRMARVLVRKRKEKGITQEELAAYIGVSKASVSKWEIGQSYPDITFLPQLAAYFNISIDELLDYQPQMAAADIRKLYVQLSKDFACCPFEEVARRCREIIRKYYSCFPLLQQMGVLLVNHSMLAGDKEAADQVIREAEELFVRVRTESQDALLAKQALYMEALCRITLGDPESALVLLEGSLAPAMPPESLLAMAYQSTGRREEAKSVLQVGMYQNLVMMFNFLPAYLMLCADAPDRYDETLRRALAVGEAFDLGRLHPAVYMGIYLAAAQGYVLQNRTGEAVAMLRDYADLVTSDIYPMRLHGDEFFDKLDAWLEENELGTALPRDEQTVRRSMLEAVAGNPGFAALAGDPQFQALIGRLKQLAGEES
ncbi:helix-turn-helix domain-containing protein [Paenibacillus spiritus]|uniref:Helix-turn-helix domain-containing protein n=1 Tax=Paenibacillus spiritus TaxID=2496557 RepID=A0A5J5FTR4_9BACL|nr:helix-turn-helix domain-containing protein [Paenibacillus spiritus]KAA8996235.1 helix-turn-helix domain-containing protein [Paenibacillus spiritus]